MRQPTAATVVISRLTTWMIRVLLGVLLLLVVLIAAILLVQPKFDLTSQRATIAQYLSTATGREVRLGGDLRVGFGRHVDLSVSDLSVANPEWAESAVLFRVTEASGAIDLFAVLSGVIRLQGVVLRDAAVFMEVSPEGAQSWDLGAADSQDKAATDAGSLWRLVLEDAKAQNVALLYRRAVGAQPIQINIARFDQKNDAGMLVLDASATANELPIHLQGRMGPLKSLIAARDIEVDLRAQLDKTEVSVRGRLGDPLHLEDIETEATVRGPSLANLLHALGIKYEQEGDIDLAFTSSDRDRGFAWESSGHIGAFALDTQGEVGRPLELNDLRFTIRSEGSNLRMIGRLFGIPALPGQAYRLQGSVERDNDGLHIRDAQLVTGETKLTLSGGLPQFPGFDQASARLDIVVPEGKLATELGIEQRERPYVDLVANARGFDLKRFLAVEQAPDDTQPDADVDARAIPDTPLSLGFLDAMDGRFRLTGAALSYPDLAFPKKTMVRDVQLDANLASGRLALDKLRLSGDRGAIEVEGGLSRTAQGVKVEGHFKASEFRYGILARGKGLEQLPAHDLDVQLTASGQTYRELAASLTGSGLLTGGSGRVANEGIDTVLGSFVGEVFATINPFAKKDPFTQVECTAAAFRVNRGIIQLAPGFVIRTDKLDIAAAGTIDLNTERIDVQFKNTPREGVGLSLGGLVNRFAKVGGTLDKPALVLDSEGTVFSGTAVAATGGLSVIFTSLLDGIASGASDPCAQIVAAAKAGATASPAGNPPDAPDETRRDVPSGANDEGQQLPATDQ